MTSNMTSIEEIVKYQQELLNYQRNQKQIQKETIKLLNSLNNSLTAMSDRLDEFAIKTNLKLDDYSPTPANANAILVNNTSTATKATSLNNLTTTNSMITPNNNNNSNKINYLLNNEIIYLTAGDILTGSNSNTNLMTTTNKMTPVTTATANKNDVFILNDLNPSLINLDQLTTSHATANKIFLINNNTATFTTANPTATINSNDLIRPLIKLDNATICNGTITTTATNTTTTSIGGAASKLNTTNNNTSDESISGEISYDESSRDDDKEIGGGSGASSKKKSKRNRDGSSLRSSVKDTEEGTNQQRLFNKFVREKVEARLGKDFLLLHEIQEINSDIMEEIKRDALEAYPPINIRPRRAWHLAKASLRCRRRSLRRQKERFIQIQNMNNSVSTTTGSTTSNGGGGATTTTTATATTTSGTSKNSSSSASSLSAKDEKILIDTCLIQPSHLTNLSSV